MSLALILAACAIALGWIGGLYMLNQHFYREVRALRDRLRDSHPNPDWEQMNVAQRRRTQPFNKDGERRFEEARTAIGLRRTRSQAALTACGIAALLALVLMAKTSV